MISIRCLFKRPFLLSTILLTLSLLGSSFVVAHAQSQLPGMKTDRGVYPEPPLAIVPNAGDKFNDPVFGTEIMRVTDAVTCPAPGCSTFYNQWPTFNSDNTRLLIRYGVNGGVVIKAFDPVNFRIGATLRTSPTLPGGVTLTWEGATWSRNDPDLIFVHVNYYSPDYPATGMKLYTYRPSTNTFALLKDFAPQLAPGRPDYLFEMHVVQDGNDDVFTFQHKRVGNSDALYFIVWKRSIDAVLLHIATDDSRLFPIVGTNACLPDKSGRWVYFSPNGSPTAGQARIRILDLTSSSWQTIRWVGEDDSPSHGDLGSGTLLGHGNFSGAAGIRSLADVHTLTRIFDYKDANGVKDWSNDQHMSLYADDENWAMMSLYDESEVYETGAFENEVMQFSTSNAGNFRRLFHHRSHIDNLTDTTGYGAVPKATISRDGRFIAFTSNWGKSGRYDLFIAKIDPAGGSVPTPTPVPTPIATPTPSPNSTPSSVSELIWVDDKLPANAAPGVSNESWNWVSSTPSPYSGAVASQSKIAAGLHQQSFSGASETMAVNVGDVLIAYVFIDQNNPPTALMLQWKDNEQGWEHRAYWGANDIVWGQDGTNGRRWMGALPPVGGWIRLEVPASQVGLEGKTVNGMAFTLYDGRATWDRAGKVTTSLPVSPGIFTLSGIGMGDAVALNAVTLRNGEFNVTTPENFGPDKQTRVMIFASGLGNGNLNTNPSNDITFGSSIFPNIAESIVVEARTIDNRIFHLPVEFVGPSDRSYGLDQINVRLIEDLRGAGSVELTLMIAGQRSNMATIKIM